MDKIISLTGQESQISVPFIKGNDLSGEAIGTTISMLVT